LPWRRRGSDPRSNGPIARQPLAKVHRGKLGACPHARHLTDIACRRANRRSWRCRAAPCCAVIPACETLFLICSLDRMPRCRRWSSRDEAATVRACAVGSSSRSFPTTLFAGSARPDRCRIHDPATTPRRRRTWRLFGSTARPGRARSTRCGGAWVFRQFPMTLGLMLYVIGSLQPTRQKRTAPRSSRRAVQLL
jgi:hypothetical protein